MSISCSTHPLSVLVALDGSPAAATAVPLARIVASQLSAGIEALHIVTPDMERAWQDELENTVDLRVRRRTGDAVAELLRAANDVATELLLLTTHGREVTAHSRLGSVAEAVIAHSIAPILLVRPAAATPAATRPLRHVLLPLDGTPTTARALHDVATLIARLGASVDVLLVAAPHAHALERGSIMAPRYVDQAQHEWPQWTGEMYERLCVHCAGLGAATPADMFMAHGATGEAIIDFAVTHRHDAIGLVRRSKLEPGRADVLRAVLLHTSCPVLLVGARSGSGDHAAGDHVASPKRTRSATRHTQ